MPINEFINPWIIPQRPDPVAVAQRALNNRPVIIDDNQQGENQMPEPVRKPKLSADVEFFLKDYNGQFRPVCGLVGATKGHPNWLSPYTGILEDNAALELNMPPSTNPTTFHATCKTALMELSNWAQMHGLRLHRGNNVSVTADMLAVYPSLNEFGCSEDFIAYSDDPMKARPSIKGDILGLSRYAAGHLHLSYDVAKVPTYIMARWLDLAVGLFSIGWDDQAKRRPYYGLAGLNRPTAYPDGSVGVEYRTMSNLWFFDVSVAYFVASNVFTTVRWIMNDLSEAKRVYKNTPWAEVKDVIDSGNEAKAEELIAFLSQSKGLMRELCALRTLPQGYRISQDV